MIKYPKTRQFREVVKDVQSHCDYNCIPLPKLKYKGTVKLHGTNCSVVFDENGMTAQSRNRIITKTDDHSGFAKFATSNDVRQRLGQYAMAARVIQNSLKATVVIYGEFCGPNIQYGVGISNIDQKIFVIFGLMVDENWLAADDMIMIDSKDLNVNNIFLSTQFKCFYETIDFANPKQSVETFERLTLAVEQECPVAKHFGVSGIGEGIVWKLNQESPEYYDPKFWFKTKGSKHAGIKKARPIAESVSHKVENLEQFISEIVNEGRLNQGIEYLNEMGLEIGKKSTGDFIKWVANDILKEEHESMIANDFNKQHLGKHAVPVARQWFFKYLESDL